VCLAPVDFVFTFLNLVTKQLGSVAQSFAELSRFLGRGRAFLSPDAYCLLVFSSEFDWRLRFHTLFSDFFFLDPASLTFL